jgi:hypothetical protein
LFLFEFIILIFIRGAATPGCDYRWKWGAHLEHYCQILRRWKRSSSSSTASVRGVGRRTHFLHQKAGHRRRGLCFRLRVCFCTAQSGGIYEGWLWYCLLWSQVQVECTGVLPQEPTLPLGADSEQGRCSDLPRKGGSSHLLSLRRCSVRGWSTLHLSVHRKANSPSRPVCKVRGISGSNVSQAGWGWCCEARRPAVLCTEARPGRVP